MNVHVHLAWIDFKEQAAHRKAPPHQRRVIALDQRAVQPAILHRPPIHKHMLLLARPARHARRADESPQPHRRRSPLAQHRFVLARRRFQLAPKIHREQTIRPAAQRAQPLTQRLQPRRRVLAVRHRGQLPHLPRVAQKRQRHRRIRQRHEREVVMNVRALRLLAAQKFSARGQIVKQLPHLHRRARRTARGLHLENFSAVNHNLRAVRRGRVAFERRQREPAHARDARQRLAAKTHRRDRLQILRALQLARRVPFETEQRVIAAHPHAVIRHANQTATTRLNFDDDPGRVGVEGILDQLLHHARRPLNDLARRDLIGDVFGK